MNLSSSTHSSVKEASHYLDTAFPIFFFLLAISFYLRTYDSAQVKITEVQMFGTILVALWLYKIFESGTWPFTKNQTLLLLPFMLMFASGVISFIRSPLPWGSFDFFIRRVVYVGLAMIAVTELTSLQDFRRITKWLIAAIAVSTIYGLIQWIDFYFFPAGPPQVGIDKFVWRRAFGDRIFSTFGNPNFYSNFLVIMVPVMAALYFRSRQFYLIPLIILTLINIKWTGSKGPAMGLIAGTTVFSILYFRFFTTSKKARTAIVVTALGIILLLGSYIVYRVFGKVGEITSFSFRMYTWLSTWEMIRDNPILGNGIGTFWVIYPAYRRPAIFHIEAKHNTETDHAENEHLEVWFDEGMVGMGFWIWMILSLSYGIYQTLKVLISQPPRAGPKNEQKIPEEAYYILGFFSGFLGMLIHNNTDVSMRFVSSGTPFWLLAGLTTTLVMYSPLPEKQAPIGLMKEPSSSQTQEGFHSLILKIFKFIVACAIVIVAIRIIRQFDWCQMRDGMKNPNEQPHFFVTWAFFLLCWGSVSWWFLRLTFLSTKLKSLCVLLVAAILQVPFWGFFVGDVNHNRAIFFSKQGIWTRAPEYDSKMAQFPREYQLMYSGEGEGTVEENSALGKILGFLFPDIFWRKNGIGGALEHYQQVHKHSPYMIMSHYFRGNVHNDWGSDFARRTQEAFNRRDWTQAEIFRKKTEEHWEKALSAYADTRKLGPNYVQMHHQRGTVYQKWGDFYMHTLTPVAEQLQQKALAEEYRKKAKEYWHLALQAYQIYYKIDPVFDQNYYRQAQIYTQLGELDKAEQAYLDHIEAKECRKPYHQIFRGFDWTVRSKIPWDRYDLGSPRHTHDVAHYPKNEAWIYLGDFYSFVKPSPQKAEESYRKAVEIRPDNIDFKKRLASFYGRVGRNQDAIQVWQEIYKLNPNDPDVQRLIQSQKKG